MLFVSFCNLALSNLPTGAFTNRLISGHAALHLISAARADGNLLCVSRDDLVAPYKKREFDNHVRLCVALKEHGISLTVSDFIGRSCVNPLMFAEVREGQSLIVVGAHFAFDLKHAGAKGTRDGRRVARPESEVEAAARLVFEIAPGSITFNLIQAANASGH